MYNRYSNSNNFIKFVNNNTRYIYFYLSMDCPVYNKTWAKCKGKNQIAVVFVIVFKNKTKSLPT